MKTCFLKRTTTTLHYSRDTGKQNNTKDNTDKVQDIQSSHISLVLLIILSIHSSWSVSEEQASALDRHQYILFFPLFNAQFVQKMQKEVMYSSQNADTPSNPDCQNWRDSFLWLQTNPLKYIFYSSWLLKKLPTYHQVLLDTLRPGLGLGHHHCHQCPEEWRPWPTSQEQEARWLLDGTEAQDLGSHCKDSECRSHLRFLAPCPFHTKRILLDPHKGYQD